MGPNPTEPASLTNYFRDSPPNKDNNGNDSKTSEADSTNMMSGTNGQTQFAALDMFLNSIGSRETKSKYVNKVNVFLGFIGLEGPLEEKAQRFAEQSANDSKWAFSYIRADEYSFNAV